jgi:menaquinol-cytochrome c reductase iron-sulfur subunit
MEDAMCADESSLIPRRKIMKGIIVLIGALTGLLLGLPVIGNILSPILKRDRKRSEVWRKIGPISQFPQGEMKSVVVSGVLDKGLYVWHKLPGEFVVFSRSCTDLGCPVKWDTGSECFFCPCHGGIFSKEGERMAGPPKLPLYRYQFRLNGSQLEINLSSVPIMA